MREELDWVARRYKRLHLWTAALVTSCAAALVGGGLVAVGWGTGWTFSWAVPVLLGAALLGACAWAVAGVRRVRDPRWIARHVEAKFPELESLLLCAVEQKAERPGGRLGFLQESVIRGALAHGRAHDWEKVVPEHRIRAIQLAGSAAMALLAVVCVGLATYAGLRHPAAGLLSADARVTVKAYEVTVTPGDTEIERGTSLVVTARFEGDLPDDATLVYQDSSGETTRLPMSPSLSDPMFGGRVAGVQDDLSYHVEYAGRKTRDFRATVFEYPRLERADVRLVFPEYTSLDEKRVEDTRRITAVEGTQWTLFCDLNKPVEEACLVDEDGKRLELAPGTALPTSSPLVRGQETRAQRQTRAEHQPSVYVVTGTLRQSGRYRLHLVDAEGRKSQNPPEFVFNATPNRRPDVEIALPARDVRVSPIEELQTKVSVWDDFGIPAYGIAYSLAGQPPRDVSFGGPTVRNERQDVEHLIRFEALAAEPDQLLSYYFWAEDVGPDGKPRRTSSDMYFAEVRHFEEIFRQGQQPPGGDAQGQQQGQQGGGNAQQAQQLAELQKQIINATWKVIRREVGATPTDTFTADARQLHQSQQAALDQAAALAEKVADAESKQHVGDVLRHMGEAVTHLTEAAETSSPDPLQPALAAEQAAYQALLKLRAREHRVIRGRARQGQQQSQSASGPQSRAARQLEQLKLKDSENRYETQRTAPREQNLQEREARQVLSRLRELARRQSDLNQRLKELQSALEEAETEEEREEIRRQLKRLRDQENQILRDTDELDQRMARPENLERMADSRRNLDETRQQIRQTTEALKEGQVSRAVASGTRAERQLSQMREEFRKQASGQFADQLRQLRDDARNLNANETRLAQQLDDLDKPRSQAGRLSDPNRLEQLQEGLKKQREDLGKLLEDARQTVEDAEQTEPVMTQRLYDTLRNARQQRLDDALDVTRSMLNRGFLDQARAAESHAGRGIEELKEGVEKAAESVLGDQDEALRRAYEELEALADELNEEIRRADPKGTAEERLADRTEPPRTDRGPERPSDEQRRAGQPPAGEQPDVPRPGAGRPGAQPKTPPGETERPSRSRPTEQPADARQSSRDSAASGARPRDSRTARDEEARPRSPQSASGAARDRRESLGPIDLERFRGPDDRAGRPITGDDFLDWSDRLRDVEEMVDDPEMRAQAARVRDAAGGIRRQLRGGSQGPNWDIVRQFVAEPLCELRDRVAEELLRRGSKESMVPIDRDPVPSKYAEQVRRYYEELGRGK